MALPDGTVLRAQWWPPRGARPLLQPQVPVVGAAVRVWRVPTAPSSAPAVVDALDPSAARVAADE